MTLFADLGYPNAEESSESQLYGLNDYLKWSSLNINTMFLSLVLPFSVRAIALTLAVASGATARAPSYYATDLGSFGVDARATAMNDRGEVVGTSNEKSYYHNIATPHQLGFLSRNGSLIVLDSYLGAGAVPHAINNRGEIAGTRGRAGAEIHAFVYANSQMQDLGSLGGPITDAFGINNRGEVVGQSFIDIQYGHAFMYSDGAMTDLGTLGGKHSKAVAINDAGLIVGDSDLPIGNDHAFLYKNRKIMDLGTLGGPLSYARAINASGQVVGDSRTKDVEEHAFLYSEGKMIDLGTLGGRSSQANGINDAGVIVGQSLIQTPHSQDQLAFVYIDGHMYDLNQLVVNMTRTGNSQDRLAEAVAINARGQIIANDGRGRAYLLSPR